jgi:MerR family transcriptional regulator, Zn(II)-responsive regulator of zntA
MRVSQLANSLNVTADTVRFYTRESFLQPIKSTDNGYKEYTEKDRSRLRFILSARQLGFSVNDIRQILAEADQGEAACPIVRRLIEVRLDEMERRFQDRAVLRHRMQSAVAEWNDKLDCAPTGKMICHLIENFSVKE